MTQTETEIEKDTFTHWGARLPGGVIRWNPGYGTGIYVPYTEAEARADVARTPNSVLVTRTETTTVETTAWVEANGHREDCAGSTTD